MMTTCLTPQLSRRRFPGGGAAACVPGPLGSRAQDATARGTFLTMDQLPKENHRLELNLEGLKP